MKKKVFSLLLVIALLFSSAMPFGVFAEGGEDLQAPEAEVITVAEEPAAKEPVAEEPAAKEPAVEEPAAKEPAVEEPAAKEPAAEEPVVEEPAAEEPVVEEPVVEEPVVEEPVVEEPVVEEPVVEEPVVEEPAVEEPAVEEPAEQTEGYILLPDGTEIFSNWDDKVLFATVNGDSLVFGRFATELNNGWKLYRVTFDTESTKDTDRCLSGYVKLKGEYWKEAELTEGRLINDIRIPVISVKLAVAEEPAVEEPAVEEPVVEEPVVEEPVVEEPAVEEPVVEEPAVEEPVVKEPAVKEPVVAEPVDEEPEIIVESETELLTQEELDAYFGAVEVFASANTTEVVLNQAVKFTVTLKNVRGTVTYQWERSANNGKTWSTTTLYGNKTKELSFKANETRAKYIYRCQVKDTYGGIYYTNGVLVNFVAELHPDGAPVITATANASTVSIGSAVKMTVTVQNTTGDVAYQWQKSANNGKTWTNSSLYGNKTKELSFKANVTRLNYIYRCVVTDSTGTYYSNSLKVNPTDEPEAFDDVTVTVAIKNGKMFYDEGESVVFTATVDGAEGELTYQWEKSNDGGATWTNSTLNGNKTKELSFKANDSRLRSMYRCTATDNKGMHFSDSVKVSMRIVTVAAEKDIVQENAQVKLTATVTKTGDMTYQWERTKNNGVTWTKTTLSGYNTATLSFKATPDRCQYTYRCAVTIIESGEAVTYYSEGIQVTIGEEPAVVVVINDVTYELVDDTYWIVITYSGTASELTIEGEIEGKKVTRIGASAFEGNKNLVSIDLPDTIEVIEKCAFKNCTNLANMN